MVPGMNQPKSFDEDIGCNTSSQRTAHLILITCLSTIAFISSVNNMSTSTSSSFTTTSSLV